MCACISVTIRRSEEARRRKKVDEETKSKLSWNDGIPCNVQIVLIPLLLLLLTGLLLLVYIAAVGVVSEKRARKRLPCCSALSLIA